jgi:uncharacterized membrane protein (UPF0127 family)
MTSRQFLHRHFWICIGVVFATITTAWAQTLPVTNLTVGFFQITAEVAEKPEERAVGLMGRRSLPPNHGMLFVFEQPSQQCFWMRNTPLPLTIAFIAEDGKIVNFADMVPFSEQPHCSAKPVKFALEMTRGWFQQRGVLPNDVIQGGPIRPKTIQK